MHGQALTERCPGGNAIDNFVGQPQNAVLYYAMPLEGGIENLEPILNQASGAHNWVGEAFVAAPFSTIVR